MLTKERFISLCSGLDFPSDGAGELARAYIVIVERSENVYERALDSLLYPNEILFGDTASEIVRITGLHPYTVNMVLCIACLEPLIKTYENVGKREMLDTFVKNLKPNLLRCKDDHGVWGIKDAFWQWMFHELWCERFGRLEFEPFHHFCDVDYNGIKKGDPVILIHIPRGKSLDMDEVMESIALGYERYKNQFEDEIVPFMTHSWLLYPPFLREVFKKGGNLQKFSELFDIIAENEAGYANFPNVFGCEYPKFGDLGSVAQDTSLQRSMLEFIKRGNLMGEGYGIFLYGKNGIVKTGKCK